MVTLAEFWDAILAEGRTEPGWHARRVRHGSVCDIRAAVRAQDKAEAVLFETASRSVPLNVDVSECVGFEVRIETVVPGPGGRVRICLTLRDRRYRDVFATLCEDVVGAVAGADTEPYALKLLFGRLHTWERFISRFGPDRLSDERQIGLFAELRFLRDEVVPLLPAAAAVRCWRGPYLEPHDFRFRAAGVEVKGTASRSPASFPVANLDQLDHGTLEALILVHVRIDVDSGAGHSLPQLVSDLREVLSASDPGAASDLDASLIEAGYLDVHAVHYDRIFRVGEVRWLEVRDGFPRLTHGAVPAGVSAASYSVSLDACAPFAVAEEAGRQMIATRL
jgi:hypothetical protein